MRSHRFLLLEYVSDWFTVIRWIIYFFFCYRAFHLQAITTEGVYFSNPCSRALPNFLVRLIPSVFVYNLLPCAFHIKIPSADFSIRIEAGGKSSIYSVDMNTRHAVSVEVASNEFEVVLVSRILKSYSVSSFQGTHVFWHIMEWNVSLMQ